VDPQRDPWPDPYNEPVGTESVTAEQVTYGEPTYSTESVATDPPTYGDASYSTGSESGGKREAAKEEAAQVKDTAAEAGRQVAGTAKEEAANVVAETKTQAKSLLSQARDELSSQGSTQKDRLTGTLHGFAKELGAMASSSEESGPLTDLAHQASRKGGEIAHWLDNHEASDVLEEVKRFARRRPLMFLTLAAAAGVLVGRLGRSAVAANTSLDSEDSDITPSRAYSGTDPMAAGYAGGVGAAGVSYEPGPAYVATGTDPAYAGTAGAGYTGTAAPGYTGAPDPGFAAPAPGYAETLDPSDPGYTESPQNPAQGYDQGIR
jgi:hypothetical protein